MKTRTFLPCLLLAAALAAAADDAASPAPGPARAAEDEAERLLGSPVTPAAYDAWREGVAGVRPRRWTLRKLPNGGWTFLLPDGTPFMPVGVEYEPLAIYGSMDWEKVGRDLDIMRDNGFNTLAVWCVDFNASGGVGRRMTIEEMVTLARMAAERGLYIQFYLNIDRFTRLFPMARMGNGEAHWFDIDYADPGYRAFVRNFAKRLAMAFYDMDNVTTIVVWEEKIGLDLQFKDDLTEVTMFFGSEAAREAFVNHLAAKHGSLEQLNAAWGTSHASVREAVDAALADYHRGVPPDDRRQFDVLEFGQVLLIDFTREFVETYKSVDPTMLFQCRNWDLFGPVRTVDPRYDFLDSFGVNNYAIGVRGHDFSFREELVKTKLVSGIIRIPAYVSNFGFRTVSTDGGTHGLVPNERIKASMGSDSVAAFSFIPEIVGSSYFTFFYRGVEGPWGVIADLDGKPLPILHAFRAIHELLADKNATVATADYAEPARLFIFHGLDAIYQLRQKAWLEHTPLSFDLSEMSVNYEVICDQDAFDPAERPVILANLNAYDRKLDTRTTEKLLRYAREGGTLIIGNGFGRRDRYLRPADGLAAELRAARGGDVSEVKRGRVKVWGRGLPTMWLEDTWYVEALGGDFGGPDAEVLVDMEVDGRRQPGLVRRRFGKGTVYYFLFSPYFQGAFGEDLDRITRTSLPVVRLLGRYLGIPHEMRLGNRGINLEHGRINIHEKPIHYFISREAQRLGLYRDEYGEDEEAYSGGVLTDDFVCFRGRQFEERGWTVRMSRVTSVAACVRDGELKYFTIDPVDLELRKGAWNEKRRTEAFEVYRVAVQDALDR